MKNDMPRKCRVVLTNNCAATPLRGDGITVCAEHDCTVFLNFLKKRFFFKPYNFLKTSFYFDRGATKKITDETLKKGIPVAQEK